MDKAKAFEFTGEWSNEKNTDQYHCEKQCQGTPLILGMYRQAGKKTHSRLFSVSIH
jgi:hypothetical protein